MTENWKLDSNKVPKEKPRLELPVRGIEDADFTEPPKEEVPVQQNVPEEDDLDILFSEDPSVASSKTGPKFSASEEEDDLNMLFSGSAPEQSPEEEKISDMFIELLEIYGYAIPKDVKIDFDGYVFNLKNCDADLKEEFTTRLEAFVAEQREKMGKQEPSEVDAMNAKLTDTANKFTDKTEADKMKMAASMSERYAMLEEEKKKLETPVQENESTPEVQSFEEWRKDLYEGKDSKFMAEPAGVDEEDERSKFMNSKAFKKLSARNRKKALKKFNEEHQVNTDKQEGKEPENKQQKEEEEESTPKEAREELRKTVEEAVLHLEGPEGDESKKQEGERTPEEDSAYLANRSGEIDAEAKKKGGVTEKIVRKIGEQYNKVGWGYKLALGTALGAGAAFSIPLAVGCISGLALQRAVGAMGMFLKFENHLQRTGEGQSENFFARQGWYKKLAERQGEERKATAILMSGLYTVGMGAAIGGAIYGAHLASETSWGEGVTKAIEKWLEHHWPGPSIAHIKPEAPLPAVHPPEMSAVYANASPGHGYEYMLKQLSEQLHDPSKHFVLPAGTSPDSDIAKLFAADAASIDTVVHQIASDPQHGFFNADGSSVQINPEDHIFIAADGQVHTSHDFYNSGPVQAPADALVTPAYPPEVVAPVPEATPPAESGHLSNPMHHLGSSRSILNSSDYPLGSHAHSPEAPSAAETVPPVEPAPPQVTYSNDVMKNEVFTDGTTHKILESTRSYSDGYTEVTVSENGHTIERVMTDPEGHIYKSVADGELVQVPDDEVAAHTAQVEASVHQAEVPTVHENFTVNSHNVEIVTDKPHFYEGADGKNIFAHGGASAKEKMEAIREFLTQNPDKTVYSADANGTRRVPWHLMDGVLIPGEPMKTNGIFGFLLKSFMKAPEPEEFVKLIK